MKINDFRCMWRGKQVKELSSEDAKWLAPFDKRNSEKKKALLLLHGFSSSPAVYRQMIPGLTMYDAIVCPALPGHGESIDAFGKVTADDWRNAAENACEDLMNNYEKVDVMGLSLGGLLACHLSKQFTLNHLYLLAPALALRMPLSLALKLAKTLYWLGFRKLRNKAGNLHDETHCEIAYRQTPVSAIIEVLTFVGHFEFTAPTCPVDSFFR